MTLGLASSDLPRLQAIERLGVESQQMLAYQNQIEAARAKGTQPCVCIAERESTAFLRAFFAAVLQRVPVVLANPNWRQLEWEQLTRQGLVPMLYFGDGEGPCSEKESRASLAPGDILLPSGGSSGQVRFVRHCWETLAQAALGMQSFFGVERISSCCLLPLYHVSGLMQVVRAIMTGGSVTFSHWQAIAAGQCDALVPEGSFLSLVPSQLQRLLAIPRAVAWLKRFYAIFLGGGPNQKTLLEHARRQQLPLAPCYGMTETAGMITALPPEAFLNGKPSVGTALPHVAIKILGADEKELFPGRQGRIAVKGRSLFRGYLSETAPMRERYFMTHDQGWLDNEGYLHDIKRCDNIVISGGEKIDPYSIERHLLQSGLVREVWVLGIPDPVWGQRLVALFIPTRTEVRDAQLKAFLKQTVADYNIPKTWIPVSELPFDEKGKRDQKRIRSLLNTYGNIKES